jgi:membrane protease YdiL (CAAX protease family)
MDDDFPSPQRFVVMAGVFEGGLVLGALALGWLLGYPPADAIDWTLSAAAWGAAASLPPMVLMVLLVRFPMRPWADMLRVVDEWLVPLLRDCRATELALIALLAGLGEEMLFRGVLQESVAGWIGGQAGTWIGLAVVSLLFGLLHALTASYAVLAGLIGLYLGWLWIATGNLLVPIAAHAAYDFLAMVYLAKIRAGAVRRGDGGPALP